MYLDWEKKLELVFYRHNYLEEKTVKLTIIEFTKYIIIWWDQLAITRRRNYEKAIENLGELKAIMKKRFVPQITIIGIFKLQSLS